MPASVRLNVGLISNAFGQGICSVIANLPSIIIVCLICPSAEQQREHPAADELPEQAAAAPWGGA